MPKFKLYTTSEVHVEFVVEADSAEAALEHVSGRGGIVCDDDANTVGPWHPEGKISVADEWHLPDLREVEELSAS